MKLLDNKRERLGDDIKHEVQKGDSFYIISDSFSIYAYDELKRQLKSLIDTKFLFNTPKFIDSPVCDKMSKDYRHFHIPKLTNEQSNFYGSEFEIKLKNKLTQKAIAMECSDWIKENVTFKSNKTKGIMQNSAIIFNKTKDKLISYSPMQSFTTIGLGYEKGDSISINTCKLENTEKEHSQQLLNSFNELWENTNLTEDITDKVLEHISSAYKENAPANIYFLILYAIFNEFLDDLSEETLPNDNTGYLDSVIWKKLYTFQKDATRGIINRLYKYNGCILADSVGLGKTFTALGVIKYFELKNQAVLVLCPKKLEENWLMYNSNMKNNILFKDRFNYDVLCHTDLSREKGISNGIRLDSINWGNYDLVVIDESHNFRNNRSYSDRKSRYDKLMDDIIKSGIKTRVLMLSATPVNNRFNDLKNQIALAYEGDSHQLRSKLNISKSIEEIFRQAQSDFNYWSRLPISERTPKAIIDRLPYDFFQILDSVTIARSRKHILQFYNIEEIGNFPERLKPISNHCEITNLKDIIPLNTIYGMLNNLKLAIYTPLHYLFDSRLEYYEKKYDTKVKGGKSQLKQSTREKGLVSLMTTNMLKRLESSVDSFAKTLRELEKKILNILESINQYSHDKLSPLAEVDALILTNENEEDYIDFDESSVGDKIKVNLADVDIISWERDLRQDLVNITTILADVSRVTPEHDTKLQHMINAIESKLMNPINDNNKKVLIFTAFADTAYYLYDNIAPYFKNKFSLDSAVVTGAKHPQTTLKINCDYQKTLTLFSPISKDKNILYPHENNEIDILIGTDCISEGQNLQDCDYLINYDIHWNPVKIIQRFGRIDRIGSINKKIQLVNYWPNVDLDKYIELKSRVENKMVIADMSATGHDNLLNIDKQDISYRKDQLIRLQNEVIELEDLKSGVSITDLGLNEFRMDLFSFIKENSGLVKLPKGLHAVVPTNEKLGIVEGVIFILRSVTIDNKITNKNRLHPYYLIYVDKKGNLKQDFSNVKEILDIIRISCKPYKYPLKKLCDKFNHETDDGKKMNLYSELLNQAIKYMVDVKEESDIDSLFSSTSTSALEDTFKELDDFELINFLVISDEK